MTERWRNLRARRPSVRHTYEAWTLLQRNNGNQYAAAITYFSFLALFPLLLLAVAVTGFVLSSHPAAQASLFAHVTAKVPGQFGQTLNNSLQSAIDARAGVGIIGLAGVLFTGLGWIGNLRQAIDAVWGRTQAKIGFVAGKIANLFVLVGLGVGILISLGLTVVGTAVTDQLLAAIGLDHVPGVSLLVTVLGLVLGVAGDMLIFWWLLVQLPDADAPPRVALKGALLAAVGFEVLKVVGTYTIKKTSSSPTAGPFAGVLAVLIWIQLVARYLLFSCAWMATLSAEQRADAALVAAEEAPGGAESSEMREAGVSPMAVGATLVGAGAIAGAVAGWAARRPRGDHVAG